MASGDVDIVLNLTIPEAHAEVSLRALEAGEHVYSEKPLATTIAEGVAIVAAAKTRGLRAGAAPDTVLGAGVQGARGLIDAGEIGKPMTGLAAVMSHGTVVRKLRGRHRPVLHAEGLSSVRGLGLYQESWAVTDMRPHSHAD